MTLLEDIQNAAVDANNDVATLLRKCKLLAARLGSQPLENWVLWESNGYSKGDPVPVYRIWPLEIKGHFSGPFSSGLKNAPIPLPCLPKGARTHYQRYECRQSIAGIETILKNGNGIFKVSTADLALILGANVYEGYNCIQAWAELPASRLVEVVNAVRNRILDFSLALWKEVPTVGETGSKTNAKDVSKVTHIFNTTVYGGSANLIGSASESPIVFNIAPKNISSLEGVLRENGVQDSDVAELREALKAEPDSKPDHSFGPKVSAWVAKMTEKAASGAWNIGLGCAGNLLAQSIGKYYGLL